MFFKNQLSDVQADNTRLIRANQDLIREVECLLNANGDLTMKLNEAENKGIAASFSRDSSRGHSTWPQRNYSLNQILMNAEERKFHLLRPNPPN